MSYSNLFRNIFLFFLFSGLGLMLYPGNTAAFSKKHIDFDRMEPFEINSVIQDISVKGNYLIVGEKKVYLIEFKLGNDKYRSAFVDGFGDTSDITALRTSKWEGKRVLVRGFKLSTGDIVAVIIKMQKGR
ncbi:MAG: hypothetical protein P8012_18155 [Desulfobacterales bacterium]